MIVYPCLGIGMPREPYKWIRCNAYTQQASLAPRQGSACTGGTPFSGNVMRTTQVVCRLEQSCSKGSGSP